MRVEGAVGGRFHVTHPVGAGRDGRNRGEVPRRGRALEHGVAEGEDATVARRHPVALAVGGRRHADHGLVEMDAARRPVVAGVAEVEDAAVGGHLPVALAVWGGGHAHDGRVQVLAGRRAVGAGVTEGIDAAVGGHLPVALAVGGGGHAHDGRVPLVARRAVGAGVTEGIDAAVAGHLPVAAVVRGGGHADDGRGPLVAGRAVVGRTVDAVDRPVAVHQPCGRGRAGPGRVRAGGGERRRHNGDHAVGEGEKRQSDDRQLAPTGCGRERTGLFHDSDPPVSFLSAPLAGRVSPRKATRVVCGSYGHFLSKRCWRTPPPPPVDALPVHQLGDPDAWAAHIRRALRSQRDEVVHGTRRTLSSASEHARPCV